jgi:hypothetical protein
MKILAIASLWLFSILQSWAQTPVTVPIVDMSEAGSPLEIKGNITFKDQIIGNSIKSSSDYELQARNVSAKRIDLFLVHFTGMGPLESGIDHYIEFDNLFNNEEITPGKVFFLGRGPNGWEISPFNPVAPSRDPVAEVRVLYAEFSDGSVYGQKRDARDILASHSAMVEALQRLDRANEDKDFLQILAQKVGSIKADAFWASLEMVDSGFVVRRWPWLFYISPMAKRGCSVDVGSSRPLVRIQVCTDCIVGWESERFSWSQRLVSVLWQRVHEWHAVVRLSKLLPVYATPHQGNCILAWCVLVVDAHRILQATTRNRYWYGRSCPSALIGDTSPYRLLRQKRRSKSAKLREGLISSIDRSIMLAQYAHDNKTGCSLIPAFRT